MGSTVSEFYFWSDARKKDLESTKKQDSGINGFLSYHTFIILSLVGGYLALDHLYLRSPGTFIAKLIVNSMFFGIWWLYDVLQAIFNKDVVEIFGLSIPGNGRIATGVLMNETPGKNHLQFFIYACCLVFGGLFGADSFALGDRRTGFIRLFSLITFIFAPIAFFYWLYNLYQFFINTEKVVNNNSEYFGAPTVSLQENAAMFAKKIGVPSLIQYIFNPYLLLSNIVKPTIETATAPLIAEVDALKTTVEAGTAVIEKTENVVEHALETADTAINTADNIWTQASDRIGQLIELATGVKQFANSMKNVRNKAAAATATASATTQGGSHSISAENNLNLQPIILIATLLLIPLFGLLSTYNRIKNVRHKDDTPPEPGVSGKPNYEK